MVKKLILAIVLQGLWLGAQAEAPVNLVQVYEQAMANDPTLASATSTNQAAQELIEQAKANYRPNVNFSAGVSTSRTNIEFIGASVFRSAGRASFDGRNYRVEARQPIFRKDSLVQIDQSEVQVSRADKQLNLTQQDLILRTTQAYFDVLLAQDNIGLIQAQKAAIQSQLEQAKVTFEVGTATITDVNEAQARYDLTLSQEIAADNQLEIAKRALQAITGQIPEKLATVKSDIQVVQLDQSMQDWQDVAAQTNLNIQIQQDTIKLAEQDIERAKAGHYPTLDAVASFSNTYSNGSPNGFGSDLDNTTVGLEFQLPLYQGGGVMSRVRQAAYNKQKALDDVELAKRTTNLETQRAFLNLSSSIAQVKALDQALLSSQSQLDSTKLGYEVGVRTSVDVLNAQQQLFSAKRDLLQARYNYLVNIIRLKAATGVVNVSDVVDINQQLVMAQ